ncbi:kinase-like domain-containing protein [Globomyces pollinis-pini]|nr:kinase-like domain-containing protein [Globomyces pollinis-pini]
MGFSVIEGAAPTESPNGQLLSPNNINSLAVLEKSPSGLIGNSKDPKKRKSGLPSNISLSSLSKLSLNDTESGISNDPLMQDQNKVEKIKFQLTDIRYLKDIGSGSSGVVSKVLHIPSGLFMARKIVSIATNDKEDEKRIKNLLLRELKILRKCIHSNVITFYGSFIEQQDINIMMEYMDLGSLEDILKKLGRIQETPISIICLQLLNGLVYLFEEHKVIHRDIKPANILVCSKGLVKLADFGIAKEIGVSMANSVRGTIIYIPPERISKKVPSTTQSDVWSFGLTIMELALGKYPLNVDQASIFDIQQMIVNDPIPSLSLDSFSKPFVQFCESTVIKDIAARPTPKMLLDSEFIVNAKNSNFQLESWTNELKSSYDI